MKRNLYRLLMILQGLLWIGMAVQSTSSGTVSYPILILMLLDGVFYILLAFPDIRKLLYKLAVLAFLLANTVLTVTDQMGFMDYLVLAWNLVLLVLVFFIIFARKQA